VCSCTAETCSLRFYFPIEPAVYSGQMAKPDQSDPDTASRTKRCNHFSSISMNTTFAYYSATYLLPVVPFCVVSDSCFVLFAILCAGCLSTED
jgi:hypothetical protein